MNKILLSVRDFTNRQKNNIIMKLSIILCLMIAFIICIVFVSYSEEVNTGLANSLIRFHVIANSDSAEDQALKRLVRDKVIDYMKNELKTSKDIEQTRFIVNNNINKIKEMTQSVIKDDGKNYSVKVLLGTFPFPTKMYGDIILPSGNYEALRIVIGNGQGANWWCVLFPPLCFVDATHGTIPDYVKQDLKNVLTEEEYNIITSSNDSDIKVKVKFKFVEFFNHSKIKVTQLINKTFKL